MITRLSLAADAVTTSTGLAQFTFASISQGFAALASVSVQGAATTDTWTISISGTYAGEMQGANTFGPVYLAGGDYLTVTSTAASTAKTATLIGVQGLPGEVMPTATASSASTVNVGNEVTVNGTMSATITGTVDVSVQNANIPVTGTVNVGTISGAVTLATGQSIDVGTISGPVSLAAGTAVDITGPVTVQTASGTPIDATVSGSVDISSGSVTATISGPVTVQTAAGTPIDVGTISGDVTLATGQSVDIGTVTGPVSLAAGTSVDISGTPTVNIAAGQVVDVQNASGGSLTVAGTIAISGGTLDVNNVAGGTVDISAMGTGTQLLATNAYTVQSATVTPPAGTGTLIVTNVVVEYEPGTPILVSAFKIDAGSPTEAVPAASVPNGPPGTTVQTWYVDVPLSDGTVQYEVQLSGTNQTTGTTYTWYIYADTAVGFVAASIAGTVAATLSPPPPAQAGSGAAGQLTAKAQAVSEYALVVVQTNAAAKTMPPGF
jgi:hypothetical protein